jgi:hypothetical protein
MQTAGGIFDDELNIPDDPRHGSLERVHLVTYIHYEQSKHASEDRQEAGRRTGEDEPGAHARWPLILTDTLDEGTLHENGDGPRQ